MSAADATLRQSPEDERAERHGRILRRLAEIGMNLAEDLDLQRREPDADAADLAMKFARIAKAVRQTLALEARLFDDEAVRREAAEGRRRAEAARRLDEARDLGLRRVRRAGAVLIDARRMEDADAFRYELQDELDAWLADEDEVERFADLSMEDAITELRRVLGWNGEADERPHSVMPPREPSARRQIESLTTGPSFTPTDPP